MPSTIFITGTDTGVGKTVLSALLIRYLRANGVRAGAFKPICSGGRADARALLASLRDSLTLDEINPWHFRAALAPTLAARRERKSVRLAPVLAHIRKLQKRFETTLVEGAGGLLSPLGEGFDSRDLLVALRATPVIVGPNKLGVLNHFLLTLKALPNRLRSRAKLVLMAPAKPDSATRSNAALLGQLFPAERILTFPWLGPQPNHVAALKHARVRRVLRCLTGV